MLPFLTRQENDGSRMPIKGYPTACTPPSESQIRTLAYRLFESGGRMHDQALVNWQVAEAQLWRKSLQTFWIAQERASRLSRFPSTFLLDDETVPSSDTLHESS